MTVPWKSRFADRGKAAEDAVQKALKAWVGDNPEREASRLTDTRAAGRIVKAAAADFEFFCPQAWGLLEVKETEHEYRLARDKVPQLARMRKREMCGGVCIVLVHHSTLGVWRYASAGLLHSFGDKGSWNLKEFQTYPSAADAMAAAHEVFKVETKLVYCHYCRKHKPSAGFKRITHLMSGTTRYQCPECYSVRTCEETRERKTQADLEVRRGEQATRVLLSQQARDSKRRGA